MLTSSPPAPLLGLSASAPSGLAARAGAWDAAGPHAPEHGASESGGRGTAGRGEDRQASGTVLRDLDDRGPAPGTGSGRVQSQGPALPSGAQPAIQASIRRGSTPWPRPGTPPRRLAPDRTGGRRLPHRGHGPAALAWMAGLGPQPGPPRRALGARSSTCSPTRPAQARRTPAGSPRRRTRPALARARPRHPGLLAGRSPRREALRRRLGELEAAVRCRADAGIAGGLVLRARTDRRARGLRDGLPGPGPARGKELRVRVDGTVIQRPSATWRACRTRPAASATPPPIPRSVGPRRSALHAPRQRRVREGSSTPATTTCSENAARRPRADGAAARSIPLLRALYLAQAFWQHRDLQHFRRWAEDEVRRILADQEADGTWQDLRPGGRGTGLLRGRYGDAYATAMNCLFLSVPEGLLPIFRR